MEKSKKDWCDSTWNPVTGCLNECKYCYAKGIANRFSGGGEKWTDENLFVLDERFYADESEKAEPYPYGFKPTFYRYKLNEYIKKNGRNIFVCSMADLFGSWVPDAWIEEIFSACRQAPQHNYLFLTKNPIRYLDLQDKGKLLAADNMWYGANMGRYDIEELVLGLADIVRENRYLRQENTRLREVEKEYHQSIIDRCRESEQASLKYV